MHHFSRRTYHEDIFEVFRTTETLMEEEKQNKTKTKEKTQSNDPRKFTWKGFVKGRGLPFLLPPLSVLLRGVPDVIVIDSTVCPLRHRFMIVCIVSAGHIT